MLLLSMYAVADAITVQVVLPTTTITEHSNDSNIVVDDDVVEDVPVVVKQVSMAMQDLNVLT